MKDHERSLVPIPEHGNWIAASRKVKEMLFKGLDREGLGVAPGVHSFLQPSMYMTVRISTRILFLP